MKEKTVELSRRNELQPFHEPVCRLKILETGREVQKSNKTNSSAFAAQKWLQRNFNSVRLRKLVRRAFRFQVSGSDYATVTWAGKHATVFEMDT